MARKSYANQRCGRGGIGRRKGLKIPRWQHRAGSSPAARTKDRIAEEEAVTRAAASLFRLLPGRFEKLAPELMACGSALPRSQRLVATSFCATHSPCAQQIFRRANSVTQTPINLHDNELVLARFNCILCFCNFSLFTRREIAADLSSRANLNQPTEVSHEQARTRQRTRRRQSPTVSICCIVVDGTFLDRAFLLHLQIAR